MNTQFNSPADGEGSPASPDVIQRWQHLTGNLEDAALLQRVFHESDSSELVRAHMDRFGTIEEDDTLNFDEEAAISVGDLLTRGLAGFDNGIAFSFGMSDAFRTSVWRVEDTAVVTFKVPTHGQWVSKLASYPPENVSRALGLTARLARQKLPPLHVPYSYPCLRYNYSVSWQMMVSTSVSARDFVNASRVLWEALERVTFQILDAGLATASVQTLAQSITVTDERTLIGAARSNYFRVKDVEAFRRWASGRDLEVWQDSDDPTLYGIVPAGLRDSGYPSDAGTWPIAVLEDGEVKAVNIPAELAAQLVDGSVAILAEIGIAGRDVMVADSIAVNSKAETASISFDDFFQQAKRLGPEVLTTYENIAPRQSSRTTHLKQVRQNFPTNET